MKKDSYKEYRHIYDTKENTDTKKQPINISTRMSGS